MARLLVILDSADEREGVSGELRKYGYDVVAAQSAAHGLRLACQTRPDGVLLDTHASGREGLTLLSSIRANRSTASVPVMVLCDRPTRQTIQQAGRLGVAAVVVKNAKMLEEVTRRITAIVPPGTAPSPPAGARAAGQAAATPAPASSVAPSAEAPTDLTPGEDEELLRNSLLTLGEVPDAAAAMQSLRALRPLISRADLLERVLTADPKAIRPAVQQVLSLTGEGLSSIEAIARAIKQDQALALKVLKVANSPLYMRGERVSNVQTAVSRIGTSEIRSVILGLGVMEHFGKVSLAGRLSAEWFWEHSIAVGVIASRLARARGAAPGGEDALFTAGLLHDVGRVVYAERLGDLYARVVDEADRLRLPLETVETRLLLMNHAELSDRLLRNWRLAPELVAPIALHHLSLGNMRRVAPQRLPEGATLALANALAHALALGSSGNDALYPMEELAGTLKLSGAQVLEIAASVPEQVGELKIAMLAHGGEGAASYLEQTREALGPGVRVQSIALDPGLDAAGHFAHCVAPTGGGAPTVLMVRAVHPRERGDLIERVRGVDAGQGGALVPVLVVTNGAAPYFAPGALGQRRVEQVMLPLRATRLAAALRGLAGATPASTA